MNIIDAIHDHHLFNPFLGSLESWQNWLTALRMLYGLPIEDSEIELILECTGRTDPGEGFDTALFLTGRRSGKSRQAAIVGAFEATLAGHEKKLSKGERGVVLIASPTRSQSRIVKDYLRAIFNVPILHQEVDRETKDGFELKNGTRIEILAGDWRTVRGFTLLAAIVDEAAFFGHDAESKVRSDTELIRAIRPSLATVQGKLIAISSPYSASGWCYTTWKANFGTNGGQTLVWNAPSRTMNPTLPQRIVDAALAEDYAAARAEYLGEFRDDVSTFLPREVIERLVAADRQALLPNAQYDYRAFVDISGGRADDAALAIAHRKDRTVIVDRLERYRPPFSPVDVIQQMVKLLAEYRINEVTGDNYSAEFVASAFRALNVRYEKSEKSKSELYLELLPVLCSGEIQLLDNELLINQLSSLERRTRSGGRDRIDHPPGQHDDVANVVAGVAHLTAKRRKRIGAITFDDSRNDPMRNVLLARRLWSLGIHPADGDRFS